LRLVDPDPFGDEYGYLWHDYSNDDHPAPLDEVLAGFERLHGPGETASSRQVEVLSENQGVVTWFISGDGSEDPPVTVDEDRGIEGIPWRPYSHFSLFLFEWLWFNYRQPFTPLSLNAPSPWNETPTRYTKPYGAGKPHANGLWLRSPRGPVLLPPY